MYELPQPLAMRLAQTHDQLFLDALFATSREDLSQAGLPEPLLAALLKTQQLTQQAGFSHHYPLAEHFILESSGVPVGRVVVHVDETGMRLLDIAVAPQARRNCWAKTVLAALKASARQRQLALNLAVAKTNHAARRLYLGQGFTVRSEDGLVEQMVWQGRER
ncbi:MAG: GNAT family N-acetyltransferase [Ramlibacter sp.]